MPRAEPAAPAKTVTAPATTTPAAPKSDFKQQAAASTEPPALPTFTPIEAKDYLFSLPAGETPMPGAPTVVVDGTKVTPSQYKLYNQTVDAVQEVVSKITYKPNVKVFVSSDGGKQDEGVYLQVGIVGIDNYPYTGKDMPEKIVYGRKWRVEKLLPTSELIQTVMLAIKSAEEHEMRERVVINGYTPLNNHLDLPLLKDYLKANPPQPELPVKDIAAAQEVFDGVHVAGCKLEVMEYEKRRTGKTVVDIELKPDPKYEHTEKEFVGKQYTLVSDGDTSSQLLYALMDTVLHESNRNIEETFQYDGFARFSRDITVPQLRDFNKFSRNVRNFVFQPGFKDVAGAMNRAIDAERPPIYMPGPANDPIIKDIDSRPNLLGAKPKR
jgi:hypothetical protein